MGDGIGYMVELDFVGEGESQYGWCSKDVADHMYGTPCYVVVRHKDEYREIAQATWLYRQDIALKSKYEWDIVGIIDVYSVQ